MIFTRNATEGAQPRRLRVGPRRTSGRATSSSSPSSSTTRTSSRGSTSRSGPAPSFRMIALDRQRRARPRRARRDRARAATSRSSPTNLVSNSLGTSIPSRSWRRGRTSRARSWSSTPRRRRRTGRSTCRRSAATSSRSRRTRCAARAASARSGAARELLEAMEPFNLGGHMIRKVRFEETTWGELPHKFEAGHVADRRGRRVRRGDRLPERDRARGDRAARARARRVRARAARRGARASRCTARRAERRAGIVSFNVEGIHPHDVAQVLDWEGVAIRAGHHCCQPLMAQARRRSDEPRELLPLHRSRRRSTGSSTGSTSVAEGVRHEHAVP